MSSPRADPSTSLGAGASILVIFGASGDLTRRKLLPALYNLAEDGLLPDPFAVVGVARHQMEEAQYRADMRAHVARAEREPLHETPALRVR
jgi:glucose-6-phosphate 1-dehydrogenase